MAFLAFLAEDTKVGERTARQYVAHLQRFTAWLEQRYQATLLEATTRDLRQYKTDLGQRQKPASVNAALAALRRFFGWAADTERITRNPAQHLTDVPAQPLAPKGFSDVERRRIVHHAEKDGSMAEAIVTLLLNTGLRVDELVTLTWQRVHLQARSGWIDVVGKGDKHRRLPLNVDASKVLEAIQPTPTDNAVDAVFRGKRGPYTARGIEYLVAELGRRTNVTHVHPHRFRHDAARRLVESVDLPTVAAWLGHERLDTVRIYSQPDEAALERAACMPAEAAATLAHAPADVGRAVPGVNGAVAATRPFGATWTAVSGRRSILVTATRLYRLRSLTWPRGVLGHAVAAATPGDIDLMAAWLAAFREEAQPEAPPQDWRALAERRINAGQVHIWQDDGGGVSLAAVSAPAVGVARVGTVYTPPAAEHVVLCTDLANPTSNSIYQKIGFAADHDAEERAFR